MYLQSRRTFLKKSALITASASLPFNNFMQGLSISKPRKFTLCLNPGNIGVNLNQKETLKMAIKYGYESMISMPSDLIKYSDAEIEDLTEKMKAHKISWGSGGLTVDFRKDEAIFKEGLKNLPKYAKAMQKAGATRMNTWILNTHRELPYPANFRQHTERLRACAKVLKDHGIRFGFEYVAPKTLMARYRYPFIRTMGETLELIDTIGTGNLGLVLDSFHWYCAEDTAEDILALDKQDIVTCDLNDARADLSRDEQIDGTREMPGATGVIDLKAFLNALVEIGYDGPMRSEPFNQPMRDMDDAKALQVNYDMMRDAFKLVE